MNPLQLGHFGLRTTNLDRAVEWYGRAFGADVRFRNEIAAFMSFDEEHHRFVLWDDGDTTAKPETAGGVDHVAFMCGSPGDLAEHYERLRDAGIKPALCINHHFTSSIYYHDPDGNEVEISCDNMSKDECNGFMKTQEMKELMVPPLFGVKFDPEELLRLHREGAPFPRLASIGLN